MDQYATKVSPGIRKLLRDFKDRYVEFSNMTINEKRATLDTMYLTGAPKIYVESVEDTSVQWGELSVPIRIYQSSSKMNVPILVYFHGGGWVLGSLESQDRFCRLVASSYDCVVISVDYRLAPENKFPAAVDDCVAVLEWLTSPERSLKWDISKIITAGDSAGGYLSAVAGKLFNKKQESIKLLHQIMIYPVTDLSRFDNGSYQKFGVGYALDSKEMLFYADQYLNNVNEATNPLASPLLDTNFSNYSATTVFTAGFDVLRDEGIEFTEKLNIAGIEAKLINFDNMVHSFLRFAEFDENAKANIDIIVNNIINIWDSYS